MKVETIERACFNCDKQNVCYKYKGVYDATNVHFNLDSNDAPGRWIDIFEAVAKACLLFVRLKPDIKKIKK